MKTVFNIWVALCVALAPVFSYGDAVIFSGQNVKTLKQNIDLFGVAKIMSGSVDPSASATSAPIGSLYINAVNGNTYRKLDAGSSTNWAILGSGGDNGTNYIKNGNAQVNTTGWATYADAAGAVPVDCTGGSPATTFTRSTTAPLDAANSPGSFIYTHGAADLQGEGASYDFTISNADKAKVLNVEIESLVDSGTFTAGSSSAASDVMVYLYDVTNATVIHPSNSKFFSNSTSVAEKFSGTFQTPSNSNSFRLCLHNATTAASGFALKLGRVKVSPSNYVYGSPITDWVEYTPTFVGFGTVSDVTVFSRRNGDSLEIHGTFTSGVATAVPATMTLGYNGKNGGITQAGTDKIKAGGHIAGSGFFSVGNAVTFTIIAAPSDTRVFFGAQYSTQAGFASANGNTIASNGQTISFYARTAIAGWSSSVQMSDNADTRVVAVQLAGTSTSVTSGGVTIVPTAITKDTHGAYTASTFTAPVPGFYQINAGLNQASVAQTAGQVFAVGYRVNGGGAVYLGFQRNQASLTTAHYASGSAVVHLNAGDTVTFWAQSDVTNTPTAFAGSIFRLSGPSAIAATETIAARYTSSTSVIAANTATITVSPTKVYDTHSAYNTGTGLFTCPAKGIYSVKTANQFNSYTLSGSIQAYLYKNGSLYSTMNILHSSGTVTWQIAGTDSVPCNAGETLAVWLFPGTNAGTLSGVATQNYVSFERVGN